MRHRVIHPLPTDCVKVKHFVRGQSVDNPLEHYFNRVHKIAEAS